MAYLAEVPITPGMPGVDRLEIIPSNDSFSTNLSIPPQLHGKVGRHDLKMKPVDTCYVKLSNKGKVTKTAGILFVHISIVISTGIKNPVWFSVWCQVSY